MRTAARIAASPSVPARRAPRRDLRTVTLRDGALPPSYGILSHEPGAGVCLLLDRRYPPGHAVEIGIRAGRSASAEILVTRARVLASESRSGLPAGSAPGYLHQVQFTPSSRQESEDLGAILRELGAEPNRTLIADRRGSATAAATAILLLALSLAGGGGAYYGRDARARSTETVAAKLVRLDRELARVSARGRFHAVRWRQIEWIGEEIRSANSSLSGEEATFYAELLVSASEKYPTVDPLVFLAIGIVESGYDRWATSRANARGLYQIWPATGRLLARQLGWEYSDEMLYDPRANTEMAALYLDMLFTTYSDLNVIFAEYNGGPENSSQVRRGRAPTAAETRNYIVKVNNVLHDLARRYRVARVAYGS